MKPYADAFIELVVFLNHHGMLDLVNLALALLSAVRNCNRWTALVYSRTTGEIESILTRSGANCHIEHQTDR